MRADRQPERRKQAATRAERASGSSTVAAAASGPPSGGIALRPLKSSFRFALGPFLWSRIGVLLFSYVGMRLFPVPESSPWRFFPSSNVFDGLARWDSGWYAGIALHGYHWSPHGSENIHFFPLYPIVVWLTMHLLPLPLRELEVFTVAGVLVSHAGFYLGLAGIHAVGAQRLGETVARRGVWLLAIAPFSFFFSTAYTEGLYLALVAWAFVFAERRRWGLACALAGLASATRIPGVFLGAGLFVEYLRQRGYRLRDLKTDCLWFLLAPLGLIGYCSFLDWKFKDPLALFKAGAATSPGAANVAHLRHILAVFSWPMTAEGLNERLQMVLSLTSAALTVLLSVRIVKRLGPGYAIFVLFSLAIALMFTVHGVGRYTTVLFPIFLVAAVRLHPARFGAVSAAFVMTCAVLMILFSHWIRVL